MIVIESDISYRVTVTDEDYKSEIDKKENPFDTIDNEDFFVLVRSYSRIFFLVF